MVRVYKVDILDESPENLDESPENALEGKKINSPRLYTVPFPFIESPKWQNSGNGEQLGSCQALREWGRREAM